MTTPKAFREQDRSLIIVRISIAPKVTTCYSLFLAPIDQTRSAILLLGLSTSPLGYVSGHTSNRMPRLEDVGSFVIHKIRQWSIQRPPRNTRYTFPKLSAIIIGSPHDSQYLASMSTKQSLGKRSGLIYQTRDSIRSALVSSVLWPSTARLPQLFDCNSGSIPLVFSKLC